MYSDMQAFIDYWRGAVMRLALLLHQLRTGLNTREQLIEALRTMAARWAAPPARARGRANANAPVCR